MSETATPSRAAVVDGLRLALAHSKLQNLSRSEHLRTVLHIEYGEMTASGNLDLQVFWDLLAEEPGFDADAAAPPMCAIKGWTERFGMEVELPQHLRHMSEREVAIMTTECVVPSHEIERVLDEAARRGKSAATTDLLLDGIGEVDADHKIPWRNRRETAWAFGAVTVAALAFLAFTIVQNRPLDWEGFDAKEYSAGIPIQSGEQFGSQVGVVLSDPAWLTLPEAQLRDQLETALRGLDALDIEVFFVKDATGKVRAIAQWYDNRARIRVSLK